MCPQTAVLWSPEKNTIPRFGRNPGEKGWKGGSEALKPLETRLAGVQAARESLVHTPWIVSHINKDNDHRAISIIRLHCIKWLTPLSTYISHRLVQTSLVAQMVKHPPAMQETQVQSLVGKIPWRRKWQPIPVSLPGKFHGREAWQAIIHEVAKNWTQLSDFTCTNLKILISYLYSFEFSVDAILLMRTVWLLFFQPVYLFFL